MCATTTGRVGVAMGNVRFWHKADMPITLRNVRFRGQSGHHADMLRCPLLTQSGHSVLRIAVTHNAALTDLVSNAVATRVKFEGLILRIGLNYYFN